MANDVCATGSSRLTIDLDAIRANYRLLAARVAPADCGAVVKADAYGHGLERCARALAGADAFGVASIADGLRLRAAGHRQRIVVLSGPDAASDLAEMRRLQLEAVVHHESQLAMLEAEQGGDPLKVWLNLDTGMHRLGFPPGRAHAMRARLAALPAVDKARQTECFRNAPQDIPGGRALSNSAGLLGWPQARENWVRIGGLLYGLSVATGKTGADFGFAPAMTLTTRLVAVNHIARGERVGYGATWECPEDMRIGVAAIGYGDGYPRSAPSGTPVRVGDAPVAVIGRVSMDLLTLDLRQAPNARVGDEVVLWGPQLPVEVIAQHANTISYELTCGVTRRVLFAEDGG